MFILSSFSSGLEFWSVNNTWIYENSELKVYIISNNWPNDLLGKNVYKTLKSCWQLLLTIVQWRNGTSIISKWGTFSPFLSLVIIRLVFPSNFIVSDVKSLRNITCFNSKCDPVIYFIYIYSYWKK